MGLVMSLRQESPLEEKIALLSLSLLVSFALASSSHLLKGDGDGGGRDGNEDAPGCGTSGEFPSIRSEVL